LCRIARVVSFSCFCIFASFFASWMLRKECAELWCAIRRLYATSTVASIPPKIPVSRRPCFHGEQTNSDCDIKYNSIPFHLSSSPYAAPVTSQLKRLKRVTLRVLQNQKTRPVQFNA